MHDGHFGDCTTPEGCWCELRRYGRVLTIVLAIFIAEVIGGILSQSLALLADAGHVLTDAGATIVAIVVAYRVRRGAHEGLTRSIGGYINAILLGGVAIWIGFEAIERLYNPREVDSWIMVSVAVFGTFGNYIQLQIMETAVDEDHVTHESLRFHIISDLLVSVGVVLGGILIMVTGWIFVDPVISLLIALMIARFTWKLLRKLFSGEYDQSNGYSH